MSADKQHVVVTGGCGFFGAWICKGLLDAGYRVTVFDVEYNSKRWEITMSKDEIDQIGFVKTRIEEDAFVSELVSHRPDAIIHLAGLQVPTCRDHPILGAKVNVIGSLNVFEAAKKLKEASHVPRIVYASSAAVFGPDAEYGEAPVDDKSAPKPASHYGAFKLCIEHCAKAYWTSNGIPSVGLRPLTVYGPGRDTGMTSFPTRAIAAVIRGEEFEIPFSGPTAYIHIKEVADMFITCARKLIEDAKVYTVGGDTVDTRGFVDLVAEVLPEATKLIRVTGGNLAIASKLDDAALRRDYPDVSHITLKDGIHQTVQAYQKLHEEGRLLV